MNLGNILSRKGYAKIKLREINTNHFELQAKINGVKGRFILDTGASNTCVDIAMAEKFKLTVEDSDTKAAGAGATGMETKIAKKNTLSLEGWKYKRATIVLLDLTHVNMALTEHNAEAVDGIIGADILRKGEAVIVYKKGYLFLKKLVYKF